MTDSNGKPRSKREPGTFFCVDKALLEYLPEVKPMGLAVYCCLASFADEKRESFPSVGTLAKIIGTTKQSIRAAVCRLKAAGLIQVKQTHSPRGGLGSNLYTLTPPEPGQIINPTLGKKSNQEEEPREEEGRDDHLIYWNEELCGQILSYSAREFRGGPTPVFPGKLTSNDRDLLLKVATLAVTGGISELLVTECREAIRHHNGPVKNRAAYFTTVLCDQAEAVGVNIKQLLAKIGPLPKLLDRPAANSKVPA